MDHAEKPKGPSHVAYQVREGADGNAHFNRVGSAFAHKDGQGFNIVLDAVPVDGRITLRTAKDRLADMKSGKNAAQGKSRDQGAEL